MSGTDHKPWSVIKFIIGLAAILAGAVLIFDKAATPGMKSWAERIGDHWIETGRKADNLQATPWLENLGVVPRGTRKKQQETEK